MIRIPNNREYGAPRGTNKYASREFADKLLQVARVWEREGRVDRFVPSRANGMSANGLRTAFYTARSFIYDPDNGYSAEDRNLVASIKFAITSTPSEGLILRNTAPSELISVANESVGPGADNEVFQNIVAWAGAAHSDGEVSTWEIMVSTELRDRIKRFFRPLQGSYLVKIEPMRIRVIAFQQGAIDTTPAPESVSPTLPSTSTTTPSEF